MVNFKPALMELFSPALVVNFSPALTIGKTTYEVIVHFNDKSSETMQDKLKRIMLREFRRKLGEKKDDFD